MEERIVTNTQKGEDVQVQNQGDVFFDVHGIVHAEFLSQDQTINQHINKNILRRLMHSVREKRRELYETTSRVLYHENAPSHNALEIREFRAKLTLLYWSNQTTLQIWPLVTSFCFPNLRKLSKELVFKTQKTLKQP